MSSEKATLGPVFALLTMLFPPPVDQPAFTVMFGTGCACEVALTPSSAQVPTLSCAFSILVRVIDALKVFTVPAPISYVLPTVSADTWLSVEFLDDVTRNFPS